MRRAKPRDTWISEPGYRHYFTDADGKDYDILDMRDALISIRANTAPNAISLSPPLRLKAIYEIASKALAEGE